MAPALSMKSLYSAIAENSSCGSVYYDKTMKCGGTADDARTTEDELSVRYRDDSHIVGILPEGEVFTPFGQYSTPPRKNAQYRAGTPDTSPSTPYSQSSATDNNFHNCNHSRYASDGDGNEITREHYVPFFPSPPDCPSTPKLTSPDDINSITASHYDVVPGTLKLNSPEDINIITAHYLDVPGTPKLTSPDDINSITARHYDVPGTPKLTSPDDINSITAHRHRHHDPYAGPIMKKNSFVSTATTTSNSSSSTGRGSNTKSRSTTPDSIERARGVTFRDEKKRVPKSVNAPLSKIFSTLSRDEDYAIPVNESNASNNHGDAGPDVFSMNVEGQTSTTSSVAKNEPSNLEISKSENFSSLDPTTKFGFECGAHNVNQDATLEQQGNTTQATSNMFTKEDAALEQQGNTQATSIIFTEEDAALEQQVNTGVTNNMSTEEDAALEQQGNAQATSNIFTEEDAASEQQVNTGVTNNMSTEEGATLGQQGNTQATRNMFTKEDLKAITPLQIATYLTIDERTKIGTKVLTSKLARGYNLADGKVCNSCCMPSLTKWGQLVETCAVCPVLKKRVLKKILDGATTSMAGSTASSLTAHAFATLPSFDISLGSDMSASKGDEQDFMATPRRENKHAMRVTKDDEHDFMTVPGSENNFMTGPGSENSLVRKSVSSNNSNKALNQNIYFLEDSFIQKAKKSLADAFKTNCQTNDCHQFEHGAGKCAVEHARDLFTKNVSLSSDELKQKGPTCHEFGFEESKVAVAQAGEMMVNKIAMDPEAMKYKDSDLANCQEHAFHCGKEAMSNASEVLTNNVACSPEVSTYENNYEKNDFPGNEKNDELAEGCDGIEVDQFELVEQKGRGEKIVVEDASADAEEGGVLLNGWKSEQDHSCDQDDHEDKKATEDNTAGSNGAAEEENAPNGPSDTQPSLEQLELENVTHLNLEQLEKEEDVESPSLPSQDEPPLETISTSRDNDTPVLKDGHPSPPPSPDRSPESSLESSVQCLHSSTSVISALGSTTRSVTSTAQSVVSNTLNSLMDRIDHTKEKMFKTEDLNEQIQFAELLAKLSAAAVELKKLEAVA